MNAPSNLAPGGKTHPAKSTYVIPIKQTRFVLKAQYFNPLKNADQPLPDHCFCLFETRAVKDRKKPVLGQPSQADGTSWILIEDDGRVDTADTEWALTYRPLFKQPDGSLQPDGAVQKSGEVFVDLEHNSWVSPAAVSHIDRRKLLRLPVWASFLKANQGGFNQSPPDTQFETTGLLRTAAKELKPFGTQKQPWLIQIDHGFYRTFVTFQYYDVNAKQRKPLPRGVVVAALGVRASSLGPIPEDPRARVAAGTAFDDNGTVYLLHERSKQGSSGMHYYFATGDTGKGDLAIIDFSVAAPAANQPDLRVKLVASDPKPRPDARYVLPTQWHSHGMQAWLKEDANGVPQRKQFTELRLSDTSAKEPLNFHLDDAVLAAGELDLVSLPQDARIALFDHLLHIRDEDRQKPHLWKTTLKRNYLPAEDAVYVADKGVDRLSRLAYFDGVFYHLLDARLTIANADRLGKIPSVGARAFMAHQIDPRHHMISYVNGNPAMPDGGCSEYLLIDASCVQHAFPTPSGSTQAMQLMHLLVHIPLKINGTEVSKANVASMLPALTHAAERWDQLHPAHPERPAQETVPRTFGLVPVGGGKAGDKVVLLRHYFGESSTHRHVFTLHVKKPGGRAETDLDAKKVTVYLGDIDERGTGCSEEESQPRNTNAHTLAHELGHVLGLPDEYTEKQDGLPTSRTRGPLGNLRGRPYQLDGSAMMNGSNQPRLRHFWAYQNRLRAEPDFKRMLDGKDYVAVDPGVAGGLNAELPFVSAAVLADASNKGPYIPLSNSTIIDPATRRSRFILYRLPSDEGTVRKMFLGPGGTRGTLSPQHRFDGLALISVRFWCEFEPGMESTEVQQKVHRALNRLAFDTGARSEDPAVFSTRFFISTDSAPADTKQPPFLRRIAIGFSPEFQVQSPSVRAGNNLPDIRVRVVKSRRERHPLLDPTPPSLLPLTQDEIDESLFCYALGASMQLPAAGASVLKTRLTQADFYPLARLIGGMLHDPTGHSRLVLPL